MKTKDVIRAWKDAGYRQSLSKSDRAKLPAHPAGMVELTDADLGVVSGGGGNTTLYYSTFGGFCLTLGICHTLLCR